MKGSNTMSRSNLNPKVLICLGITSLAFQGGLFYNSVAFDSLVRSDEGLVKIVEANPMIVTDGIAYFLIGDIIGGAILNPIMDIIGPRYFAMLGSLVNIFAYGLLGFAPRSLVQYWMSPVMLLIGLALQLVVNPTLFLGHGLGPELSVLLFLIMGASCEGGLIICSIWAWSGISLRTGCIVYLMISIIFAIFAYFCFYDTYDDFNLPSPTSGKENRQRSLTGDVLSNEDCYHRQHENDLWSDNELVSQLKSRGKTMSSFYDDEDSFYKDLRPAKDIIVENWFIRMTVAYTVLFFVFQCQTTYWSAGTQTYPILHKLFILGTCTSLVFGITTGFVGKRFSSVNVAKYYCFASSIVAFALASQNEYALITCTFMYFTFKASLFTIWFSLMNHQYPGNQNLGLFFAVPQFLSSSFFWLFNLRYGTTMAGIPDINSRLMWLGLGMAMSCGFVLIVGLKSSK